jgi:hypothetical protein
MVSLFALCRMTGRVFFNRFPSLFEFFLDQLQISTKNLRLIRLDFVMVLCILMHWFVGSSFGLRIIIIITFMKRYKSVDAEALARLDHDG